MPKGIKEYLLQKDTMNERENLQYQLIKIHNEISYLEQGLIHHSLSDADIKYTIHEIEHLQERERELEEKLGLR